MHILDAVFLMSNTKVEGCPDPIYKEVAFIGRSNVGKSSLINMLVNKKGLAKTSSTPGKTQTINHFEVKVKHGKNWYLVDLPGYGYAKKSKSSRKDWQSMIKHYLEERENLTCTFVLIDLRLCRRLLLCQGRQQQHAVRAPDVQWPWSHNRQYRRLHRAQHHVQVAHSLA